MPIGNNTVTHTLTNLHTYFNKPAAKVCVAFLLPPGIKGLNLFKRDSNVSFVGLAF